MKNILQLKQWLFNKPAVFSVMFFGLIVVLSLAYSVIQTFFGFNTLVPIYFIFGISFIYSVYYMIKKLPHDKLYQSDFIAITNGTSIISIISSIIAISVFGLYGPLFQTQMMRLYFLHPVVFGIVFVTITLISLYILGVAISGVYAKYKRTTSIGVSPWKVILSMPFAFLLLWTPGYLIEEKTKKSNLVIKSQWYTRFNNWIMSNFSNILFVFLFFVLAKAVIAGLSTLIFTGALLVIYALWYTKHKSDFIKNIDKGYALTCIGINFAILISVIVLLA